MEIERKFLLNCLPLNIDKFDWCEIEQAYISYDPEIRIRRKNCSYYLTKKGNGELIRTEIEKEIDDQMYYLLLDYYKENNVIKKKRYYVPLSAKLTAEVDIYEEQLEGLNIVEVEFDTEEEAETFVVPNWFGEEVTYIKEYKNANLSKKSKHVNSQKKF